ncbi:MAG: DEAD/DEAH box helicase family protein [Alphaproteobacteria bacterium]
MNNTLYSEFENLATKRIIKNIEILDFITQNLSKNIKLRDYQKEAIKRFIYYFENKNDLQNELYNNELNLENKNHLLFNMATGSGKTVIMVAVMLYLYKKGYRNFLFLSHLNSINSKTENNFFESNADKYLFNKDNNLFIKQTNTGDFTENDDLQIAIKTYAGLLADIKNPKESSFSLESLRDKKVVIIADESHHLNAGQDTKSGEWEQTVNDILNLNESNFLLEFTATIPWEETKKKIYHYKNKYNSKCIIKYDIVDFYKKGWTKQIDILQRQVDLDNLMLGAVVLNKYRETLALKTKTPFKPVLMFKSDKVDNSLENHRKFNSLIENLNITKFNGFYKTLNDNSPIKTAFDYLVEEYGKTDLIAFIKEDFKEDYIINTNKKEEVESEKNAKLLNSLENKDNQKRIIFTVDKLNEGWDVLNLFDIVKLYETQTTGQTTQEAQLIGRGARYCPFDIDNYPYDSKYKRKFKEEKHKFSILEQLYFHSKQSNASIRALREKIKKDFPEKEKEIIQIKIKDGYTEKLQNKVVYVNQRTEKEIISKENNIYEKIKELANNFNFKCLSNEEKQIKVFSQKEIKENLIMSNATCRLKISEIPEYIKQNALIHIKEYNFNELGKKLKIKSFKYFIEELDKITLTIYDAETPIKNTTKFNAFVDFLRDVLNLLSREIKQYTGSKKFIWKPFLSDGKKGTFRKDITLFRNEKKEKIETPDYYIYDNAYLTSEEKSFVEFFNDNILNELKEKYKDVLLVRNENDLKLYLFENGAGFEPDFILFFETNEKQKYQVFIEPKGSNLLKVDTEIAKNDFLKEITRLSNENTLELAEYENKSYKILGLQLYNEEIENKTNRMKKEFTEILL